MKKILFALLFAFFITGCRDYNEYEREEVPVMKLTLPLVYENGKYSVKTDPVEEVRFNKYFNGVYSLIARYNIASNGNVTRTDLPLDFPTFGVVEKGKVREYIDATDITPKTYKNGAYSYDENLGEITFTGAIDKHPEARLLEIGQNVLYIVFADSRNNSNDSVLTIYFYEKVTDNLTNYDYSYGVRQ